MTTLSGKVALVTGGTSGIGKAIATPFGRHSTAAEVAEGIDLSGKRAIVTGAASGIGIETARALASIGAEVTLAVRNTDAGAQTAADITATTGNQNIHVAPLDLSDRDLIAQFVAAWDEPLHILVNNAGMMASPEQHTPEGWEMQFATNHLGHFALALGLHDALAEDGAARIVSVSSSAHLMSPVVFDDIHFAFRPYDPWLAYGQSKTANILFAVGATARWFRDGITANALMPGAIATNLQRHIGGMPLTPPEQQKTPEQGAATSVLLATSVQVEGIGGRYFEDCNEATIVADHTTTGGQYDLIEGYFPPGSQTPPHRHTRYSEQLYVLKGEFTVWAGENKVVLRAGESFLIPIGTPHVVAALSDKPARGLVVAAPSAFARLIAAVGTPDETAPPDMELAERISAEIGDEILGPPGTLPADLIDATSSASPAHIQ